MRVLVLILVLAASSAGCVSVYKMEVQQGNVVAPEMIEKVKPGMTRAQVRFVLGTPLVSDPFHPDRWDYVYFHKKKSSTAAPEIRRLTAIFDGDALSRLEGDMLTAPEPAPPNPAESAQTPAHSSDALSRAD